MRICLLTILIVMHATFAAAAERAGALDYEPSAAYPFGRPNPEAPPELAQFHFMVGKNDCAEQRRVGQSNEWVTGERTWDARYYLNGFAVLDSGRSGSATNGNLRVYDPATGQWHVHFFSMPVYGNGIWSGGMEGENMVLRQPQKAPGTDLDGVSRLTFTNISDQRFDWTGEWISADGSFVFQFWRISCRKVQTP